MTKITPVFIPDDDDAAQETPAEPKLVEFFRIGNDIFLIPEEVPANVIARYFRDVRNKGDEYAIANALIELVGEEAWDVLCTDKRVAPEHLKAIVDIAQKLLMGAGAKVMGKSRAERRRSAG